MKRIEGLVPLSDDHHTALVIAQRCKAATEATLPGIWASLIEARGTHFEAHFHLEQSHLVPALEALGESEHATKILADHAEILELLGSDAPTLELLHALGAKIETHVRYEEREVFEQTQHALPAEALSALTAAADEIPRSCPSGLLEAD